MNIILLNSYWFAYNNIEIEMEGSPTAFHDIPLVTISPEGIFKYILIKATISEGNKEKTLNFVRGD